MKISVVFLAVNRETSTGLGWGSHSFGMFFLDYHFIMSCVDFGEGALLPLAQDVALHVKIDHL